MKAYDRQWAIDSNFNYDDALKCYHCGGDNLHQRDVSVFFRREDADVGLVVDVSPDEVHVAHQGDQAANPSDRRDGITIRMDCEFCDKYSFYHIIQHKGFTATFMSGAKRNESV